MKELLEFYETRNWLQGDAYEFDSEDNITGACISGAIVATTDSTNWVCQLRRAAGCSDLVLWNDHPSRTKEDIIETIRKAIEMTVDECLEEMIDHFKNHEWIQHRRHIKKDDEIVGSCLMGAIDAVVPGDLRQAVHWRLYPHLGYEPVSAWNDEPGRTREEVIEAIGKAIGDAS